MILRKETGLRLYLPRLLIHFQVQTYTRPFGRPVSTLIPDWFLWGSVIINKELNDVVKECRSTVREEALCLTMLSAVTPTL